MAGASNVVIIGQQTITASSQTIWVDWNTQYATIASGSNASNQTIAGSIYANQTARVATQYVWAGWNQAYTTGALTTSNVTCETIWASWVQLVGNQYQHTPYQPDPVEQMQVIAARRAREQARERLRVEADERADRLLVAHLTEEQRKQYEKDRFFDVHTMLLGKVRRYRLTHGWAGNVFLLDDKGRRVEKFCIHPTQQVPYADNLLAQKLLLETDEDRFLKIANRTPLAA